MTSLFEQYRKRIAAGGLTEEGILQEMEAGEGKHRELKSSLRWNIHTEQKDEAITLAAMKTIAGFLNSEGGVLYLGVADDGEIVGIEQDRFANEDKFLLHSNNVAKSWMGQAAAARITPRLWKLGDKTICRVECPPSPKPVYLTYQGQEKFYVRSGPSTEEMGASAMNEYVAERF